MFAFNIKIRLRKSCISGSRLFSTNDKFTPSSESDPNQIFHSWLTDRQSHPECKPNTANFATLSTIDMTSTPPRPCSRTVSIAEIEEEGSFLFATTLSSAKSKQMIENPACNLTWNWSELRKSVRVDGDAQMTDDSISDRLWLKKDRSYWIWACSTMQYREIESIETLQQRMEETRQKYENIEQIPRPSNWIVWCVEPQMFEFWHGSTDNLHHRNRYERVTADGVINWKLSLIEP